MRVIGVDEGLPSFPARPRPRPPPRRGARPPPRPVRRPGAPRTPPTRSAWTDASPPPVKKMTVRIALTPQPATFRIISRHFRRLDSCSAQGTEREGGNGRNDLASLESLRRLIRIINQMGRTPRSRSIDSRMKSANWRSFSPLSLLQSQSSSHLLGWRYRW